MGRSKNNLIKESATQGKPMPKNQQEKPRTQRRLSERNFHILAIAGIIAVSWLFLSNCLENQFTDWDDAGYLLTNSLIKDLSFKGIKEIFSTPVMGNYHPITILTYALEYSFVQFEPFLYHFDNLWLHIMTTVLVYWFTFLLTKRKTVGIITSLLFGIHPMHIEAVAWVADRKDLLYSLFFAGGLISYTFFINENRKTKYLYYAGTIGLFLLSLLSKPVAVCFPIVLILMDFLSNRKWDYKLIIEKTPFLLLSVVFGVISFKIQQEGGAMAVHKVGYSVIERLELGGYALCTYLWKAVLPIHLCNFYPYPPKSGTALPLWMLVYPIVVLVGIFTIWYFFKKKRLLLFPFLFFLINIFLLLQFVPVGDAIIAERYAYLPYLGLFMAVGFGTDQLIVNTANVRRRNILLGCIASIMLLLGIGARERNRVWYDTKSLWADEIGKEPLHAPIAYNNLGYFYFNLWREANNPIDKKSNCDSALALFRQAVVLKPDFINSLQGLGMLSVYTRQFDSAKYYYSRILQFAPTAEAYSDYGNVFMSMGKIDSALVQYTKAIELNQPYHVPYLGRGKILYHQNDWDNAVKDFNKAIEISPEIGETYYEISVCYAHSGNFARALQLVEQSKKLNFTRIDTIYYRNLKLMAARK